MLPILLPQSISVPASLSLPLPEILRWGVLIMPSLLASESLLFPGSPAAAMPARMQGISANVGPLANSSTSGAQAAKERWQQSYRQKLPTPGGAWTEAGEGWCSVSYRQAIYP